MLTPRTRHEAAVRAKAAGLGIAQAPFVLCDDPDTFARWADRVAHADCRRARGTLVSADLDECDAALGIPPSRSGAMLLPSPLPFRTAAPAGPANGLSDVLAKLAALLLLVSFEEAPPMGSPLVGSAS